MRRSRSLPLIRGTAAAAFATFTALVSHVVAGGVMPSWLGILTPTILSIAVSILLARRTLSLLRLSISVLVSQAFFHVLFVVGSSMGDYNPFQPMAAGHDHLAMLLQSKDLPSAIVADPGMWLGHVVAAVLTIATFYRGERAARSLTIAARALVAWVRRAIARSRPIFTAEVSATIRAHVADVRVLRSSHPERHVDRRGPPLATVV